MRKYGKRWFYSKGCRDKDKKVMDETGRLFRRDGTTYGWAIWEDWAVDAYRAGYCGTMP